MENSEVHFQPPFEEQFKKREYVEVDGSKVENVDITPPHPEGNPVGFNLGWTGQIDVCRPFYEGFFKGDKRVLSIQYPTKGPTVKGDELPEGFSEYGYRNANAFVETVLSKGITKIDLVGHSEGTGITLMAAKMLREKGVTVENIILVNPVGFREFDLKTNLKRLKEMGDQDKKLIKESNSPEMKKAADEAFKSFIKLAIRHPKNTASEGLNVSRVDMASLLAEAYQNGQNVSILQAGDDPFVPYEELSGGIASAQQKSRLEDVDELRKLYPDLLTDNQQKAQFDAHVQKLNEAEDMPYVVTTPDSQGAGHLFNGFYPTSPHFYVPHVVDLLNYFATQRKNEAFKNLLQPGFSILPEKTNS